MAEAMSTINPEQFKELCAGVWRDRSYVIAGRGFLTADAALMRAVYWRLCKAGIMKNGAPENYSSSQSVSTYEAVVGCVLEMNAQPRFDGTPYLRELRERYQEELTSETGDTENADLQSASN
jgi:hypothetical protein